MGGFTKIQLRDCSQENIDKCNQELREFGLRKDIHFYSEKDTRTEWEYYRDEPETRAKYYPPHLFPQDISSYSEFKKYWSTSHLGEVFVPPVGALKFDCYFGRTSKRAMHAIARWLLLSLDEIKVVEGSYSTFVERCGYKAKTKQKLLMSLD
jgi:hypothetical protein